eukprot:gnl/Chilomastix_caulleri/5905.p1 GENE.gnl/Chilomastix_caulleri/5905~~gnl/Chilomastix_caulleri/5905.p1  ORF type:complete len:67 (+),score=7.58 gnl/Chilomastix_caulleri/5905:137-337(+)
MNGYRFLHTKPAPLNPSPIIKTNNERAFSVLKDTMPREKHGRIPYKATQTIPEFQQHTKRYRGEKV